MAEQIDRIVLWRHPESEHARWLRLRMGDRTYRDLVAKQDAIVAGARADGIEAVIVAASVDEMIEACRRLGVEPDQHGRSLAIVAIDAHRCGIDTACLSRFSFDADGECIVPARLRDLADREKWRELGLASRQEALDELAVLAGWEAKRIPLAAAYSAAVEAWDHDLGSVEDVRAARDAYLAVWGDAPIEVCLVLDDEAGSHSLDVVRFRR